jgi:hypothetical protein
MLNNYLVNTIFSGMEMEIVNRSSICCYVMMKGIVISHLFFAETQIFVVETQMDFLIENANVVRARRSVFCDLVTRMDDGDGCPLTVTVVVIYYAHFLMLLSAETNFYPWRFSLMMSGCYTPSHSLEQQNHLSHQLLLLLSFHQMYCSTFSS